MKPDIFIGQIFDEWSKFWSAQALLAVPKQASALQISDLSCRF